MPKLTEEEIENRFAIHEISPEEMQEHRNVQIDFSMFANYLNSVLAEGRYKALALTSLEEANTWAHKAITEKDRQARAVPKNED